MSPDSRQPPQPPQPPTWPREGSSREADSAPQEGHREEEQESPSKRPPNDRSKRTPEGRSEGEPEGQHEGQRDGQRDGRHEGHASSHTDHPPAHELGFELPKPAKLTALKGLGIVGAIALLCGGGFVFGYLPKRHARHELEKNEKATETDKKRVEVTTPKSKSSDRSVELAGSIQGLEETTIYPRASGYVKKWLVDLGDKVTEGQVLCEIETPELDQQVAQARAQLAQGEAALTQAKANRDFSKQNLTRYETLASGGFVAQQELDQHKTQSLADQASVGVAEAATNAQRANIQMLVQLKNYSHIVSPFAGTVNARLIERGALVSPTTPLFKVSIPDPVRVFVQVPQNLTPSVRPDVGAGVTVREYAGRKFEGKVARSAGALDPMTRTMKTEIRVPNPKGELLSGMYAQVALTLPSPHTVLELPSTTLLNDSQGLRVAVVTKEGTIHLVKVTLERDTGPTIEVAAGLNGDEQIVKLAGADLVEGLPVEIAEPAVSAPPAPAGSK